MNGEAIYASQPWSHQNDSLTGSVWYTAGRPDPAQAAPTVFAILLAWPRSQVLELGCPETGPHTRLTLLGGAGELKWTQVQPNWLVVSLPAVPPGPGSAWTIRMEGLENAGNKIW